MVSQSSLNTFGPRHTRCVMKETTALHTLHSRFQFPQPNTKSWLGHECWKTAGESMANGVWISLPEKLDWSPRVTSSVDAHFTVPPHDRQDHIHIRTRRSIGETGLELDRYRQCQCVTTVSIDIPLAVLENSSAPRNSGPARYAPARQITQW